VGWVERQGVRVEVSDKKEDINIFLKLLSETAQRHSFRLASNINYYKEQFLSFKSHEKAKLYVTYGPGELESTPLASAVVLYWGKIATYLHAASSAKAPKLRAPYLMQWRIITDAKTAGLETYDFWGVAKDSNPKDPWAGVTAFKSGFGGEKVCYEKPYDLILNPNQYYVSKIGERVRKLLGKFR